MKNHVGFTGGALIVGFFVWMFWLGWWPVVAAVFLYTHSKE
jgi:hypothetical protein